MSVVRGIGLSKPLHSVSQVQASAFARAMGRVEGAEARFVDAVHRRSGIERRGSVIAEATGRDEDAIAQSFYGADDRGGPTTGQRMAKYAAEAGALAVRAAAEALDRSGISTRAITHLVTASCTGFAAPGVDSVLIDGLGLTPDIERTNVGFMGCHGAINALRVADALADRCGHGSATASSLPGAVRPRVALVVCVELCTLHMHHDARRDRVVANALFADGAAAMVVTGAEGSCTGWRVVSTASRLIEGTRDAMAWRIGDHGFEMTLGEGVPGIVRERLGAWAREWLGAAGIESDAFDRIGWAVHPGGPRVLDAARDALGIGEASVAHSRAILATHGNMSSPTVLFIADRIARETSADRMVMLAFGPGLTIEGALLARV